MTVDNQVYPFWKSGNSKVIHLRIQTVLGLWRIPKTSASKNQLTVLDQIKIMGLIKLGLCSKVLKDRDTARSDSLYDHPNITMSSTKCSSKYLEIKIIKYSKYYFKTFQLCCLLCEWDGRDKRNHYHKIKYGFPEHL